MRNFTYKNPTKIVFGKGTLHQIGKEIKPYAKKVLLTYGKSSIKQNGIYERIIDSLDANDIEYIEYSGIQSNPLLSHARKGVEIAKKHDVDAILAVGGGSVIDESKAIAIGAVSNNDIWEFILREAKVEKALPIFTVLTIPATGSEMNCGLVLTNEDSYDKFGWGDEHLYPVVSVLDPELTLTISKEQTAYTSTDIIAHSIEAYFTKEKDFSPFLDGYVENLVKSVIVSNEILLEDASDIDARSNLMWTATMAWNGLNHCGTGTFYLNNHQMEHPISAIYGIAHGAGLAILMPAWMKYFKQQKQDRLSKFFKAVFDEEDVDKGIEKFESFLEKIGAPTSFKKAGIDNPDIKELTKLALKGGEHRGTNLSEKDVKSIYELGV